MGQFRGVRSTTRQFRASTKLLRNRVSRKVAPIGGAPWQTTLHEETPLRGRAGTDSVQKGLAYPTRKTWTKPTLSALDGLRLDPNPERVLTIRPTLLERLERPELMRTDAQYRNVELGRLWLLKFGTVELAAQAVDAAREQDILVRRSFVAILRRKIWRRYCMHQLWQNADQAIGTELSYAQLHVAIREAALENSRGLHKLEVLHALERAFNRASALETVYPLRRYIAVQITLSYTLIAAPFKSLRHHGFRMLALSKELKNLAEDLRFRKQDVHAVSDFERQYNMVKGTAFNALLGARNSLSALFRQHSDLFLSIKDPNSIIGRLDKPMKTFKSLRFMFSQDLMNATVVVSTIVLRRQSLKGSKQQNIFSALHHHIKTILSLVETFYKRSRQELRAMCMRATQLRSRRKSQTSPILRHEQDILSAFDRFRGCMRETVDMYYEDFMYVWPASIKLMSNTELARQDRIARRYWLSCLEHDTEHESRLAKLQDLSRCIKNVRQDLTSNPDSRVLTRHSEERANVAIAQLAQLYAAVSQKNARQSACPPCQVVAQGRATTTGARPPILHTERAVLWELNSRAISRRPLINSAVSRLPNNVSKDPMIQFQVRQTAYRLMTRHKIPELAVQVLDHQYTQAKKKSWGWRTALGTDCWKNTLMIFDHSMTHYTAAIFYMQQVTAIRAVAHQKTHNCAKSEPRRALQRSITKSVLLEEMLPFDRQIAFLDWMHETLKQCPHPKLQAFSAPSHLLLIEMDKLVDQVSYLRIFISMEEGFEKRFEAVKKMASGAVYDKLDPTTSALRAMLNDCVTDSTFLSKSSQAFARRILAKSLSLVETASEDVAQAMKLLIKVQMRRQGSKDRRQNVFNSLHHHVELLRAETSTTVTKLQHLFSDVVQAAMPWRMVSLKAHPNDFVRIVCDLEDSNEAMLRIYYDGLLPLRAHRIDLLPASELNSQNRIAQRYWLHQINSHTVTNPTRAAEDCLRTIAKSIRRARNASQRQKQGGEMVKAQAIQGIEALERLHPSLSSKSVRSLQELKRASMLPGHHRGLSVPKNSSGRSLRRQDLARASPRQMTERQKKLSSSSGHPRSLDEILRTVKADSAWR